MRKMCDGKRPADGFVLDVGGAGVGEIGGPLPAARKMISDQRRDDTSVLAMDLHQKAVSYRRVQDLVQASIRSHEALLGECQKQLDRAHSQSLEVLEVCGADTTVLADDGVPVDIDPGATARAWRESGGWSSSGSWHPMWWPASTATRGGSTSSQILPRKRWQRV